MMGKAGWNGILTRTRQGLQTDELPIKTDELQLKDNESSWRTEDVNPKKTINLDHIGSHGKKQKIFSGWVF